MKAAKKAKQQETGKGRKGLGRGEGQPSTTRRDRSRLSRLAVERAVDQTLAKPKNKKKTIQTRSTKAAARRSGPRTKSITKLPNHQLTKLGSASFTLPRARRTYFPQAKGRIVKQVEFFSDPSNNTLELTFQDDTSLSFEFEPSFVWEAYFARWKSGEQRILHRWPPTHSQL